MRFVEIVGKDLALRGNSKCKGPGWQGRKEVGELGGKEAGPAGWVAIVFTLEHEQVLSRRVT